MSNLHTGTKVYLKASNRFIRENSKDYKNIVASLSNLGLHVSSETDLFKKYDKQDLDLFYKEALNTIKDSDVFVAEISVSSSTTGYQIAYALSLNKPVLLLKSEESNGETPVPLDSNPSKLVTLSKYTSDNLDKKITSFLKKADKGIFVKRLPIEFTQDQVEYVQYRQGLGSRLSFNATIRKIIDEALAQDNEYKEVRMIQE